MNDPAVADSNLSPRGEITVALGIGIGAAIALGFSRFAYALLLPPMREALGLTYAEAGSLNTANGVGYVVGAIACAGAAKRWGAVRTFQVGALASALVLLATALVSTLGALFIVRTIGGFTTALAFILGAALAGGISRHADPARSSLLVGTYIAGGGAGIVLSGLTIPWLVHGAQDWRLGWLVLGALAVAGIVPAWLAAGHSGPRATGAAQHRPRDLLVILPTMIGYTFFGAGYAGFMTFVIALLRASTASGIDAPTFWVLLGAASIVGSLLWGRVLGRLRGGNGPALVYALITIGTLPLLVHVSLPAAIVTAVLFGGSIMAGPGSITVVARQQLPPASLTFAVSALTVAFALGQAGGPLLSGAITDMTGSVATGLWTSPVLLGIGALIAWFQPVAQPSDTP